MLLHRAREGDVLSKPRSGPWPASRVFLETEEICWQGSPNAREFFAATILVSLKKGLLDEELHLLQSIAWGMLQPNFKPWKNTGKGKMGTWMQPPLETIRNFYLVCGVTSRVNVVIFWSFPTTETHTVCHGCRWLLAEVWELNCKGIARQVRDVPTEV